MTAATGWSPATQKAAQCAAFSQSFAIIPDREGHTGSHLHGCTFHPVKPPSYFMR
jgi:hypothetical protein